MTKRRSQSGDCDVTHARKQKTVESQDDQGEEESDMGMDVVPIQGHPRTEIQLGLGLPSDPSTSQVGSHDEISVSGIHASGDRWTPTEHSALDRGIMKSFPFLSSKEYRHSVSPAILVKIAELNNNQISWEDAKGFIQGNKWLWDLLIACWEKGSFKDIRRLSECLLYTFPVNNCSWPVFQLRGPTGSIKCISPRPRYCVVRSW